MECLPRLTSTIDQYFFSWASSQWPLELVFPGKILHQQPVVIKKTGQHPPLSVPKKGTYPYTANSAGHHQIQK